MMKADKIINLPLPQVSSDRVIGGNVGLRPCRKNGIRIESETLNDKLLIHNYGYCGMGISLSWGGAYEVLDILKTAISKNELLKNKEVAVVGAGIIGLTTAYVLSKHGFTVHIYAKDVPPHTTSDVAGGLWGVYTCSQPTNKELFDRIQRVSFKQFSDFADAKKPLFKGVEYMNIYTFFGSDPGFTSGLLAEGLIPKPQKVKVCFDNQKPRESLRYSTLRVDVPMYMHDLFEHVKKNSAITLKQEAINNIRALHEDIIINCAGLGARELVHDNQMHAIKGQLVYLQPQPDINFMLDVQSPNEHTAIFLLPHKNKLVIGVSFEEVESYAVDENVQHQLLSQMQDFLQAP